MFMPFMRVIRGQYVWNKFKNDFKHTEGLKSVGTEYVSLISKYV